MSNTTAYTVHININHTRIREQKDIQDKTRIHPHKSRQQNDHITTIQNTRLGQHNYMQHKTRRAQ